MTYRYTMTERQSESWDDAGPSGEIARRDIRHHAAELATEDGESHVEVYSHDDITMDAFDLDDDGDASELFSHCCAAVGGAR